MPRWGGEAAVIGSFALVRGEGTADFWLRKLPCLTGRLPTEDIAAKLGITVWRRGRCLNNMLCNPSLIRRTVFVKICGEAIVAVHSVYNRPTA